MVWLKLPKLFDFKPTQISGLQLVRPLVRPDARGRFVKLVHAPSFESQGLVSSFAEHYVSNSKGGVLRGMHFQIPPHDHVKLVYCLAGEVVDTVLDLRASSETFGQSFSCMLSGEEAIGLYIPRGLAHGFLTLSAEATMAYFTETTHHAESDAGVRWDSFGFKWPCRDPVLSARDAALMPLDLEDKVWRKTFT